MSRHSLYDTVFDGGCFEHIYNITQAFKNCSPFCKPGVGVATGIQVYALVQTVEGTLDFSHTEVQQSDYECQWTGGTGSVDTIERRPLTRIDVETELK